MPNFDKFYSEMYNYVDRSNKIYATATDAPSNKGKVLKPELEAEYQKSLFVREKGIKTFIGNMLKKGGRENFANNAEKLFDKDKAEEFIGFIKNGVQSLLNQKAIKNVKPFDDDKEYSTKEEVMNAIFTCFDSLGEQGKELWNAYSSYMENKIYLLYNRCTEVSNWERLVKVAKEGFGENLDEFTPESVQYASWEEKGELADNHPYEEKIIELKKENSTDKEYISALDDANNIIISGDKGSTTYMSNYAENLGRDFDDVRIKRVYDTLLTENPNIKDVFDQGSRLLQLKSDASVLDLSNAVKSSVNNACKVSENQKQAIKDVLKKMTDAGIFNKDNFETESKHKIYGLSLLINTARQLQNAVDEGNRDKIIELSAKYRETEKIYDDILKDISKLDDSYSMASNISSSRESNVPYKYRNDPLGVSRLNGLWMFIGMCDNAGISVNDMIDDPAGNMYKITLSVVENSKLNKYIKDNDLSKVISELAKPQGEVYNVCFEDQKVFDSFPRGMDGLMMVCGNNDAKWDLIKNNMVFQGGFSADITGKYTMLGYYLLGNDRVEKLQRMMLVEKQDLDLLKLDPEKGYSLDIHTLEKAKKFNKEDYLETKTTPAGVVLRSVKVLKDFQTVYKGNMFEGDVKTAVLSNMELLSPLEKSPTVDKAIQAIKDGELDKITEEDIKILQSEAVLSKEKLNTLNEIESEKAKKYDGYVKDMLSFIDNVEGVKAKQGLHTLDDEWISIKSAYQLKQGASKLIENVINKNGIENAIETAVDIFPTKEMKDFLNIGLNKAHSTLSSIGIRNVNFPDGYENKPFEEKVKAFKSVISSLSKDDQKNAWERFFQKTVSDVKNVLGGVKTKKDFKAFIDKVEDSLSANGGSINKCIPDKSEYASIEELGAKVDKPVYEKEINSILADVKNPSKELKFALEDANKILVLGSTEAVSYTSSLAEELGEASMFYLTDKVIESLKKDKDSDIDIDKDFMNVKSALNLNDNYPAEKRESLIKKYGENQTEIKPENRQKLLNIIKKIQDNGLFDPSTYQSESGSKIYGMRKLYNCREDLIKAIEQKDTDKIIEAQKNYRATEKIYDEILKDLKELDGSSSITSNISSSREKFIPAKYRNDPVGVSKLSGLWQYMGLCHSCGASPEEIINNPTTGINKLVENTLDNSQTKKYIKEHDLSDILLEMGKGVNGEYFQVGNKDIVSVLNFTRGVDSMLYISGDDESKIDILKESQIYSSAYIGSVRKQVSACGMYYLKNNTEKDREDAVEKISRMILVEKEDLDPLKISPDAQDYIDYKTRQRRAPFDKENYAKEKTTPHAVVSRMLKVLNDYNAQDKAYKDSSYKDLIVSGVKQVAKTLDNVPKTETVAKICSVIKSKNPYNVKKTDLLNFNAETKFFNIEKKGITTENISEVVKDISDLKKQYEGRNFFAKIFYSSVRRQNRIIDSMITKLTEKGISRENLNSALKGYDKNDQESVNSALNEIKIGLDPNYVTQENVPVQKVPIEVVEANTEQNLETEVAVSENEKQIEISPEEKDYNH